MPATHKRLLGVSLEGFGETGQPQTDTGDVHTPDLVEPHHWHAAESIRVHLVLRVHLAGVGAGCHASQTYAAHQSLRSLGG
jgi:hypothetical protein